MMPAFLDITILGSGTSTGIPVVGCECSVCCSSDPRNRRTRCSVMISLGVHNVLIDTSTDLRQQALRENVRNIDAVLYTHSHADHVHGIDDLRGFNLRSRKEIPIFGAEKTLERICLLFDYIFSEEACSGYVPQLKLCPVKDSFDLFGLTFTPIPLLHGDLEVLGYRCGPVAYLTDCSAIPESSMLLLQNLQLLIIDGLRFKPHPTHFNISQATDIAQQLGAERTLLTHLSHDVDHGQHEKELPKGIELAFDGQRITLPLDFEKPVETILRSAQL